MSLLLLVFPCLQLLVHTIYAQPSLPSPLPLLRRSGLRAQDGLHVAVTPSLVAREGVVHRLGCSRLHSATLLPALIVSLSLSFSPLPETIFRGKTVAAKTTTSTRAMINNSRHTQTLMHTIWGEKSSLPLAKKRREKQRLIYFIHSVYCFFWRYFVLASLVSSTYAYTHAHL